MPGGITGWLDGGIQLEAGARADAAEENAIRTSAGPRREYGAAGDPGASSGNRRERSSIGGLH